MEICLVILLTFLYGDLSSNFVNIFFVWPVLVFDVQYQYWQASKMPVLVLARVTKGKIPVWASSEYTSTSIGSRSVPVLALLDQYQYWQT
jgi:hypothetical protein